MPTALITGANRGIGLEFAAQYYADGWQVFAAARNPEPALELQKLAGRAAGKVKILPLDVRDAPSISHARDLAGNATIDHLINCAGVYGGSRQQLGKMDYDAWTDTLAVNTMGPMRVTEAFIENVAASHHKLVVSLTSGMGSIADNTSGSFIAYRSSKAAVNMVMRSLAIDLAPRGVACIVINPGWVKTRMGGPQATITAAESVRAMRKVFQNIGPGQSGHFFNYDGHEYPW